MRFLLITTTQEPLLRSDRFLRLLRSVNDSLECTEEFITVHLACVAQGVTLAEVDGILDGEALSPRLSLTIIPSESKLSLSAARNIAIDYLNERHRWKLNDTIVAFPDDDCAYRLPTLSELTTLFKAGFGLVVTKHGEEGCDEPPFAIPSKATELPRSLKAVSSNAMFIDGTLVDGPQKFDENLGLGTKGESAEDLDYFIRAWITRKPKIALISSSVIHPRKKGRQERYYKGNVFFYRRYVGEVPSLLKSLIRQFFVGIVLVALLRLKPSTFISSWKLEVQK